MRPRMACKPRLDVSGGLSHVIVRDNQRATIFHDNADYCSELFPDDLCEWSRETVSWPFF